MASIVGVDIGGTKIIAGVVATLGTVTSRAAAATPRDATADEVVEVIAATVKEAAAGTRLDRVGLGVAAWVSADGAIARFAPHLPMRGYPLQAKLAERLGVPVHVENDANTAIWAETRFGASRRSKNVLGIFLGTGIGGGLVIGGRLLRGFNGMAGEPGHMCLVPGGLPCSCGQRGCFEMYASGNALGRYARELVEVQGRDAGLLYELCEADPARITGVMVSEAARAGDRIAHEAFDVLGTALGEGLASLCAVYDPEIVVVGGGLVEVIDLYLPKAQEVFAERLPGTGHRDLPPIVPAELGHEAGLLGAADLARLASPLRRKPPTRPRRSRVRSRSAWRRP